VSYPTPPKSRHSYGVDNTPTARDITVVLADDHPVVRNGLRALISSLPGFTVVAEAADGYAAVREAQLVRPDVVIMDVRMPGLDGIEATRRITASSPSVAVLVLTMFEDDETVLAAMRAGARGYLLKGAGQEEIDRAVRAVVAGEAIFGPGVAARVLAHITGALPNEKPFPDLTIREREVLELIAAGERNSTIADRLALSPKTISNHISAIFGKLGVADRPAAIVLARRGGLGGAGGGSGDR
jgi:DNA-binding NarL/FixJ family response regulator